MYLLPQPEETKWWDGKFCLRYDTGIIIDTEIPAKESAYVYEYAKLLQREIDEETGFTPGIRREKATADRGNIFLTFDTEKMCADKTVMEAYSLQINETGVRIRAGAPAGILYGVQTLRQIIRQSGAVLPCVEITDAPKILDRGLSYDVTRGRIPTLAELKRQADVCSFYKMNQLQIYVEHSYMFREFSEVWRYNTPLTAEEILELDAYCKKRNIELVPALASFGHLYEVLHTKTYAHLCELENSDREEYSLVRRMGHHTVDVSNAESLAMVTGRIEEFMGLFTSKYFNICADETFDLCKGKSKALGEEKGVKRVYLDFLKKICNFVIEKGRIPMFWGDVLLEKPEMISELPGDAICLNWEYYAGVTEDNVKKLTEAGVKNLYLCPGVQSWNHLINKHSEAYQNIFKMCRNAHKYHARGVLNTEWGDLGHIAHPEFSTIGQIYGAAFSWSDQPMEEEEINRGISVLQYGDAKGELVSLFRDLADTECVNWWHAVEYKEKSQKGNDTNVMNRIIFASSEDTEEDRDERIEQNLDRNQEVLDSLYEKLGGLSQSAAKDVSAYILMGEGQKLLTMVGKVLYEFSRKRSLSCNGRELAVKLEYWLAEYSKLWRSAAKESELFRIVEVISWYADRLRELEQ